MTKTIARLLPIMICTFKDVFQEEAMRSTQSTLTPAHIQAHASLQVLLVMEKLLRYSSRKLIPSGLFTG
jgi:hypothetical protein